MPRRVQVSSCQISVSQLYRSFMGIITRGIWRTSTGPRSDVPFHLHQDGVEIHLGYGPLHGNTVLGEFYAEVDEGYAMPIPPKVRHGYVNDSTMQHHVPFIFGSLTRGGWGVFLDVEAQPIDLDKLEKTPVYSRQMNQTIYLEREIEKAARRFSSCALPNHPGFSY